MMRILVVEDEKDLNRLLCRALTAEGYSTDACHNGEDALLYASGASYDVIIMDIMLPKLDGLSVVERLRTQGCCTPILFLSAKSAVEDKIRGLEAGGDYYLTKPFQTKELLAVIRAMLRKYSDNKTNVYTVLDLTVNLTSKTVERGGVPIELTAREFALLEYMVRNKGVVLSRDMIINSLWNYDHEGGTNVIDVYIGYLRRKIDADHSKKLIHTVWGSGWRLSEE